MVLRTVDAHCVPAFKVSVGDVNFNEIWLSHAVLWYQDCLSTVSGGTPYKNNLNGKKAISLKCCLSANPKPYEFWIKKMTTVTGFPWGLSLMSKILNYEFKALKSLKCNEILSTRSKIHLLFILHWLSCELLLQMYKCSAFSVDHAPCFSVWGEVKMFIFMWSWQL